MMLGVNIWSMVMLMNSCNVLLTNNLMRPIGFYFPVAADWTDLVSVWRVLVFSGVHSRGFHCFSAHDHFVHYLGHWSAVHLLHDQGVRAGGIHNHHDHAADLLALRVMHPLLAPAGNLVLAKRCVRLRSRLQSNLP